MGGHAFKNLLPNASFPRMQPSVYDALKTRLQPILQALYTKVVVAPEAPGKTDYGDLDFIVLGPREGLTADEVKAALRATCSVPMEGNRTSNFAIPVDAFQEVIDAHKDVADKAAATQDGGEFCQVDVNVCADDAQLERNLFYTSYGDFGFLVGLLAHTAGLSFSHFGLKLADPVPTEPPQTFFLSTSLAEILTFFGLSMDRWKQGFTSEEDVFKWAATSPFILPLVARYRAADYTPSIKDTRPLRQHFVKYLQTHDVDVVPAESSAAVFAVPGNETLDEKVQAALRYFGKQEEHVKLLHKGRAQRRARAILNGTNVQEWTGVRGMPIRFILDEVKERLSATNAAGAPAAVADAVPGWQNALLEIADEEVRKLVVKAKEELDEAGKLAFDWRTAKAARLERKRQREQASCGPAPAEIAAAA